eukprot:1159086-Pelagomonas_calceolata.AAC.11
MHSNRQGMVSQHFPSHQLSTSHKVAVSFRSASLHDVYMHCTLLASPGGAALQSWRPCSLAIYLNSTHNVNNT